MLTRPPARVVSQNGAVKRGERRVRPPFFIKGACSKTMLVSEQALEKSV